jgi:Aldo/keto reductase family
MQSLQWPRSDYSPLKVLAFLECDGLPSSVVCIENRRNGVGREALGLNYVGLLLIHWPQPKVPFAETLGVLAKAKRSGLTRHVGVSNFTLAMLEEAAAPNRWSPIRSSITPICRRPVCSRQSRHDPNCLLPGCVRQAA